MSRLGEWKARFAALVATYGVLALVVWWTVFALTILSVRLLLSLGVQWTWLDEMTGGAGSWVAAYAVAKLLGPLRFALVVAILPAAARWRQRLRGGTAAVPAPGAEE